MMLQILGQVRIRRLLPSFPPSSSSPSRNIIRPAHNTQPFRTSSMSSTLSLHHHHRLSKMLCHRTTPQQYALSSRFLHSKQTTIPSHCHHLSLSPSFSSPHYHLRMYHISASPHQQQTPTSHPSNYPYTYPYQQQYPYQQRHQQHEQHHRSETAQDSSTQKDRESDDQLFSVDNFSGYIKLTAQLLVFFYLIKHYVGDIVRVQGRSMEPTFRNSGDRVIYESLSTNLRTFLTRIYDTLHAHTVNDTSTDIPVPLNLHSIPLSLQRGDIVICYSTVHHPSKQHKIIKRVIALGGDTIYVRSLYSPHHIKSVTIPPGHVWLQGDNLEYSGDSRAYGPVHQSTILGKVVMRIWPLHKISFYGQNSRTLKYAKLEKLAPQQGDVGLDDTHEHEHDDEQHYIDIHDYLTHAITSIKESRFSRAIANASGLHLTKQASQKIKQNQGNKVNHEEDKNNNNNNIHRTPDVENNGTSANHEKKSDASTQGKET